MALSFYLVSRNSSRILNKRRITWLLTKIGKWDWTLQRPTQSLLTSLTYRPLLLNEMILAADSKNVILLLVRDK